MRLHMFAAATLSSLVLANAPAAAGALSLRIAGVKSDEGIVRLCVFSESSSKPEAYPDCQAGAPVKSANAAIKGGEATVTFKNLPDGAYAVSLFHDADGDGKISMKSMFGVATAIPREGIGISNNPTLYGKPKFTQARFTVKGETAITITMKYF
ncbi:MAG: DUF2141 domain-containing protein [Hyphomicrobiales bacterium]|nr:DUF2141 domain-containing protein [Hyphomicrobiales bacterium]